MIMNYATQFIRAGIGVIPIGYRDKRPAFKFLPLNGEGKPSWEIYKTTLPTIEEVNRWLTTPNANWGVVAGWQGLVVLDFDDMAEYNQWLFWATRRGGISKWVSDTAYRVSTNRGVHVYVRLPHREKNRKAGKVDIKGDGYVLGAGSTHPSGTVYQPMRTALNFPLVQALSDVLPSELLVPPQSNTQPVGPTVWQTVAKSQPAMVGSLVRKIRNVYHVEDQFPNARQTGNHWLMTQCPFHDDHNPSFWLDTERQICGCFAGCTPKPLDVINLYGRLHGLNNQDAIFAMARGL